MNDKALVHGAPFFTVIECKLRNYRDFKRLSATLEVNHNMETCVCSTFFAFVGKKKNNLKVKFCRALDY